MVQQRMATFITLIAFIVVTLAGCSAEEPQGAPGAGGGMAFPPVPVSVGMAVQEDVPIVVQAVGNVEPYSSVQVKAQVGGPLLAVRFAEGANVRRGDLLFEIDPRPF